MPHEPRPIFRASRNNRYVEVEKKQHVLGKHPKGVPAPKKNRYGKWSPPPEILQEYHRVMTSLAKFAGEVPVPACNMDVLYVASVLDAYLDWLKNRVHDGSRAQRTFDWYHDYLQDFIRFGTDSYRIQDLTITQLEPVHVYQWADSHPWG